MDNVTIAKHDSSHILSGYLDPSHFGWNNVEVENEIAPSLDTALVASTSVVIVEFVVSVALVALPTSDATTCVEMAMATMSTMIASSVSVVLVASVSAVSASVDTSDVTVIVA